VHLEEVQWYRVWSKKPNDTGFVGGVVVVVLSIYKCLVKIAKSGDQGEKESKGMDFFSK